MINFIKKLFKKKEEVISWPFPAPLEPEVKAELVKKVRKPRAPAAKKTTVKPKSPKVKSTKK